MEEGRKRQETEDTELTNEFRKPRDLFLNVIAEFYSTCQPRLKSNELRRMLVDAASRPPTELLDHRSHNVRHYVVSIKTGRISLTDCLLCQSRQLYLCNLEFVFFNCILKFVKYLCAWSVPVSYDILIPRNIEIRIFHNFTILFLLEAGRNSQHTVEVGSI